MFKPQRSTPESLCPMASFTSLVIILRKSSPQCKGNAEDAKGHTIWSGDEHSNASTLGLPAEDQKEEAKVEPVGLFE